jgi:tRNA threonylcarbamoyladenosine biosynthesis protein TsaB
MALILCIETATEVCSVALFRDETLVGIRESSARNVHSSMLTTFIDILIKSSDLGFGELDAIAVSMGPGSYTGLRIGVATAKGLSYALDRPLIAVSTLQAMAAGLNYELKIKNHGSGSELPTANCQLPTANCQLPTANCKLQTANCELQTANCELQTAKISNATLICPMIDARRMEVYCGIFNQESEEIREVRAEIIDEYSFQDFLADHVVVFGGEGAVKCKSALGDHPNALFIDGFEASARFMIGVAAERFRQHQFEDLAYFEPFYLKDFVAGKPRVKGLN